MIEIKQPGDLDPPQKDSQMLSNKHYDLLKRFVQLFLPAFASLYFGLAQIWGLPSAEEVVGTTALISTFLGVILGISTHKYNPETVDYDGQLVVMTEDDGRKMYSLELEADPETLAEKKHIIFRVHPGVTLE